jgi:acetyl-CoA synthetase
VATAAGAASALKPAVDEAVAQAGDLVEHVLVVRRTGQDVDGWDDARDVWWHDVVDPPPPSTRAEMHDAEHHRSTSCTPPAPPQAQGHPAHHGRLPRGHVVHPLEVFDLKDDDVYWCTTPTWGG